MGKKYLINIAINEQQTQLETTQVNVVNTSSDHGEI